MTPRRVPGYNGVFVPPTQAKPKKAKKAKKNWLDSFTKIAVMVILVNSIAWVWCSYVLAYLGRYAIAESLSQTAVNAIIGTFIAYALKSTVENVNKHGVNLWPRTTIATTDAIIVGVNANLEE